MQKWEYCAVVGLRIGRLAGETLRILKLELAAGCGMPEVMRWLVEATR